MKTIKELLDNKSSMEVFSSNTRTVLYSLYSLLYSYKEVQNRFARSGTGISIAEISFSIYTTIDDYIWKRLKEFMPDIVPVVENHFRSSESHIDMLTKYTYAIVDILLDNDKTPSSLIYDEGKFSLEWFVHLIKKTVVSIIRNTNRDIKSTSIKTRVRIKINR